MPPIGLLRRTAITRASSLLSSLVSLQLLRFGMANVKPKKCITIHYRPPPTMPASAAERVPRRVPRMALPARNRPVKVSRGEGSPGSGPADSPSGRYRGVDRIFPAQHHDRPAQTSLLDVLPAWVRATGRAEKSRYSFRWQGTGDAQPVPPPVLPAGASPGSTVLPGTTWLPPAVRVTFTRRAWAFGDAGMVTCRTPSA